MDYDMKHPESTRGERNSLSKAPIDEHASLLRHFQRREAPSLIRQLIILLFFFHCRAQPGPILAWEAT